MAATRLHVATTAFAALLISSMPAGLAGATQVTTLVRPGAISSTVSTAGGFPSDKVNGAPSRAVTQRGLPNVDAMVGSERASGGPECTDRGMKIFLGAMVGAGAGWAVGEYWIAPRLDLGAGALIGAGLGAALGAVVVVAATPENPATAPLRDRGLSVTPVVSPTHGSAGIVVTFR